VARQIAAFVGSTVEAVAQATSQNFDRSVLGSSGMKVLRRGFLVLGAAACVPAWAGSYEDFFVAIQRDDAATITTLLQRGFDPNTRDPRGQVGLMLALKADTLKAFDALMQARNLQVEVRNAQDESPLMMAALRGHLEAVRALIARDADVNKPGWTASALRCHGHTAAAGHHHCPAPGKLRLHRRGFAQWHHAVDDGVHYGTSESVQLLLQEGADPSLKNQLGLSAADFALRASRKDMADLIAQAIRQRQPNRGRW
jgi:hypothetical protein